MSRRLLPCLIPALLLCIVAAPRPAEAAPDKALDEYFKGKVIGLEGKTVTLRYDFRDRAQIKDWSDRIPFRIKPRKGQRLRWFDDKLEIIGNSGARHKGEWIGDVEVTATFIPDLEKDFGGYMSPVSETEDQVTFTFVETFFHAYNGKAGGLNSIIKFGAQWRETDSDEYIGFRYGARKPPKKSIVVGRPIRATFGRVSKKLFFRLPEYELKNSEKGKKLKRYHVGFYAIKGRMLLDNIEIKGTLASDWMKRERVELRTAKPIGGDAPSELDDATKALIEKHKGGKSTKATRQLVSLLKDEEAGAVVHTAVIEALTTGPKKAIHNVVDLLYSTEEKVRERGALVVQGIVGDDFGYKAKSSEKSRTAAIRKLLKAIKDNPTYN
ncbi:MAG: hypothetical protein QNJ90_00960 [Planctomycetota bacterium]|nr:hypothetical protein [Planctomycetota bacterium]